MHSAYAFAGIVFVEALVFALLPLLLFGKNWGKKCIELNHFIDRYRYPLESLLGGLVFGVATLALLQESLRQYGEPPHGKFPTIMFVVGITAIMAYVLGEAGAAAHSKQMTTSTEADASNASRIDLLQVAQVQTQSQAPEQGLHFSHTAHTNSVDNAPQRHATFWSVLLPLIMGSTLAGMGVGALPDAHALWVTGGAILAHKWAASMVIADKGLKIHTSLLHICAVFLFTLSTPIATIVTAASLNRSENVGTHDKPRAVVLACASGALVSVSMRQMLPRVSEKPQQSFSRLLVTVGMSVWGWGLILVLTSYRTWGI